MATGLQVWSKTAASNNSADSNVNWAEGMAPSAVNDSARAEMASAAKWRDDNNGTIVTTGSTTAYTVTSNQVSTGNTDGYTLAVKFHATNDSSATLARDTAPAANLQLIAGTNVAGGEFLANTIHRFKYDSGSTAWIAQGPNLLGASAVSSNNIAAGAVAYSKIQNETAGTILGNGSTSAGAPAELTIGTGLSATATSISAPAFPPQAAFKNLVIKTASTTTINASADFVTLATSGSSSFITIPTSGTINMASTGVANGLDTGALAFNTFYAIYAIAPTSTSTHADLLASTSFTTPLMPSGYAYKARIGAQVTNATSAVAALHGIYQIGRRAQYVVGVAGTTTSRNIGTGTAGTFSATSPTLATASTTLAVPATASTIYIAGTASLAGGTAASILVAPSTSWSGTNMGPSGSVGMIWPLFINAVTSSWDGSCSMILEDVTKIAWASGNTGGGIACLGWDDNL